MHSHELISIAWHPWLKTLSTPLFTLQLGPLRAVEGTAEIAGCLSAAGLVGILALCLTLYGAAQFQSKPTLGVKTLSGRSIERDSLQTSEGWSGFTAGWLVGGLGGVAWAYVCTQVGPRASPAAKGGPSGPWASDVRAQ